MKSIESRFEGGKKRWIIILNPEKISFGGNAMEATILTNKGQLNPEKAAELRARRILFNDPPFASITHEPGGDLVTTLNDGLAENAIQGDGPHRVKTCELQKICSDDTVPLPQRFQIARLAAIFQLIVGNAVEHVRYLALGPVVGNKVHLEFRGTRARRFANVDPVDIKLEGDCELLRK